jgi:hypothetical protein
VGDDWEEKKREREREGVIGRELINNVVFLLFFLFFK